MRLVSHRGAAGLEHENSLAGIAAAPQYAPDYIEVDINRTRDGIFVLHHGNIKRAYLGTPLEETLKDLKTAIPQLVTLKEFLKLKGGSRFMLDIKVRSHTEELIEFLKQAPDFARAFTSPHPLVLDKIQAAFPGAKTIISQPYHEGPLKHMKLARTYGFSGIGLNKWWLNPFTYIGARRHGMDVMVYTVDHPLTMRLIQRFYPDVLLVTNRPDIYRQIRPLPTEAAAKNQ